MTAKELVRQKFIQARLDHADDNKKVADHALRERLQKLLHDLAPLGSVMAYRPLKSEANPFHAVSPQFAYPRVNREDLQAYRVSSSSDFVTSNFGVMEPDVQRASPVQEGDIGVVLVPGLAFDRRGHRLGFGKGFYDRFLKKTPQALRVGVAYSFQISTEDLPKEAWDEAVDWIVSDRFVLRVARKDHS